MADKAGHVTGSGAALPPAHQNMAGHAAPDAEVAPAKHAEPGAEVQGEQVSAPTEALKEPAAHWRVTSVSLQTSLAHGAESCDAQYEPAGAAQAAQVPLAKRRKFMSLTHRELSGENTMPAGTNK